MDYTKPESISNALEKVDKIFLQTLPTPNITDISSNFIREAKKKGVRSIVKLSAMGANSEPTSTILRLHGMEEKSYKNLEYLTHSCVLLHLCKIL